MSTTDQLLTAIVIGLAACIISLAWSLQQAHHRLDQLEDDVYDDEDQATEHQHTGRLERAEIRHIGEAERPPETEQTPACSGCRGRGYVPDWTIWDAYHGEPKPKPCPDCAPDSDHDHTPIR